MRCTLREWQRQAKQADQLIRAASTVEEIDGLSSFSIGLSPWMWQVPDATICSPPAPGKRTTLLQARIFATDAGRRPTGFNRAACRATLEANGFDCGSVDERVSPREHWRQLQQCKFVASPEGNGVDSHRTYEALIAGAVPIVEDTEHIRAVYGGAPILYTRDYSEVTPAYLEAKYAEMLDIVYDFGRLYMSGLTPAEKGAAAHRSRLWRSFSQNGTVDPNDDRLEIKGCCGKRKRGDTDSDVIAAAKPGVVVTVNTKTANNGSVSDDVPPQAPGARRQAWARRKAGKPHNRRRRPGQHNTAVSGSDSSHGSSLVHRRISAASGGSVVVREALAMVDTCNNWMACLTQGTVDFSLPAGPASLFGTCIVSPQRQVMSLSGFDAYVQQPRAMAATTHINDVFQKNFAALVLSLVNSCFERKIASAIRLVHRRLPYNVVAYPLTVPPDIVEGVLLVYREDQVAPAEFSNLIVTPCKMSNSVSF